MCQNRHSNESDWRESQQGDNFAASPCSVLEHVYHLVDPVILTQEHNDVVARRPRIVLTCGAYDDENDESSG